MITLETAEPLVGIVVIMAVVVAVIQWFRPSEWADPKEES